MAGQETTLASRVRAIRKGLGITQEDLARLAGLTASTVAKIEQGTMANPRLDTLAGLAKALGAKVGDLLGE